MPRFLPILCLLLLTAPFPGRAGETLTVRIGYQKYGTMLLLKESGKLDATLKAQGIAVDWREFPGGPQLLEALNVGAVDIGTTGEAPPIFAQAAGAPLVYVSVEPPAPHGEAIIVRKDSPIHTVADLKGRKVALNKGSNVHFLLVRALEEAGLAYTDIQPVYLAPADARAAFERGAVDAWAIWDPYYAAAAASGDTRLVADGVKSDGTILVPNHEFQLAHRTFYAAHPDVVKTIIDGLKETEIALHDKQAESARLLSPRTGVPVPVLETAFSRMGYGVGPITPEIAAEQQHVADTFQSLGLIPKHITIADALPGSGS